MGMLMTLFFDIVLAGVELPMVGSASGVLNANQQLGSAIGIAALGTVFFGIFDGGQPRTAVETVLWSAAILVLISGALAVLLPRGARGEEKEPAVP